MRLARTIVCLPLLVACGDEFGVGGASGSTGSQTSTSAVTSAATSASQSVSTSGGGTSASSTTASASASSSTGRIDCDQDADLAEIEAPGCCRPPELCDCDDTNPNVFPGQVQFFAEPRQSAPTPLLAWDYDCDGAATPEHPFDPDACGLLTCDNPGVTFDAPMPTEACGTMVTVSTCLGPLSCMQAQAILACR